MIIPRPTERCNEPEEWIHEVDLVKTNHSLVPRVFVDPTDLCSREPRPKGGRSGAPGGRNRLVHDDELGSEQRVHGSLSKKISVFETVGFPFRRRGFAQPRLIGGESGKISFRRRPWHGGDCFATDGTGSSGSIQFRRTENDPGRSQGQQTLLDLGLRQLDCAGLQHEANQT